MSIMRKLSVWCIAAFVISILSTPLCFAGNTKNIMLTGYWPPTNEMLRQFSTDPNLNPDGWKGQNWEGRGYDVYAFFPEFPGGSGAKGEGDFEVDYQDVTADFWRITEQIHPVAIMSYGQGGGQWEIENWGANLSGWSNDYYAPLQPTPTPPDSSVPAGTKGYSTLPKEAIRDAINAASIGVTAWIDDGGPGNFLCNYMAYHDSWYQRLHSGPSDPYQCVAAGFTHVSSLPVATAVEASEIALRATIAYLDTQLAPQYTLTIIIDGNGSVSKNPSQQSYSADTEVALTALPAPEGTFVEWTGDATGSQNPLTVVMDGNKVITAHFQGGTVQYQLTTNVVGNGSVSRSPDSALYAPDAVVAVTAVPAASYLFSHWSGDAAGTENPINVTMDLNKNVTANFVYDTNSSTTIWGVTGSSVSGASEVFVLDTSSLTITKLATTSTGTVHSDIAVTPSGQVYTVGNYGGSGGFTYLMQLNPSTGQIVRQWNLGSIGMNALTAQDDLTLLGIQYGGAANLIKIQLDAGGAYVSYTNLGQIDAQSNSGGDITHTPDGDFIAATNGGGSIYRVPVVAENPNPAGATLVCNTTVSGIGALAYDYNSPGHTLYAGSYSYTTIYTLDLSTGQLAAADITNPGAISYPIYGMDTAKPSQIEYTLTVNIDGNGNVGLDPALPFYGEGAQVTLTAQPAEGSTFVEWTGDATGSQNPLTVVMDGNKVITAHFQGGTTQYELTVGVVGNGSVLRDPDTILYDPNTSVALTAVPASGHLFSHWSGDAAGTENPLNVVMNSNKNVVANFILDYTDPNLIWGVTGSGTDSSSRSEIFVLAPSTLTITKLTTTNPGTLHTDIAITPSKRLYAVGNFNGSQGFNYLMQLDSSTGQVTRQWNLAPLSLNALTARSDSILFGVTYGGTANVIKIELDADGAYISNTNLGQIDAQSGSGGDIAHTPANNFIAATDGGTDIWRMPLSSGNPNPAAAEKVCETSISAIGALAYDYSSPGYTLYAGSYNSPTIYTLNLTTGQLSPASISNPGEISYNIYGMDTIKPPSPQYTLTVIVDENGSVDVNPVQQNYDAGEEVTLTAVADSGYIFSSWSGDLTGSVNPSTIVMDSNKTITAHFQTAPSQYTLNISILGSGSVQRNPAQSLYDPGTEVALTAVPASGYVFSNWSGDASGTQNPLTVVMNSNKNITAYFSPIAVIWGVTGGAASEVFTLNTSTMTITKLITTSTGTVHADIAVTPSGQVYTVGNYGGSSNFTYLMRLNPATGAIIGQWNLSISMNALSALDDSTLLGVTWQGNSNLIKIQLDGSGSYLSNTNLGRIDAQSTSGGDLGHTPSGDYLAATNGGSSIYRIPIAGGNPNPAGATWVCTTNISGVGGLAYDYNAPGQPLYAGSYLYKTIYTLNLSTGILTPAAITNPTILTYNIYGLGVAKPRYIVAVSAGTNGTVSPAGDNTMSYGSSLSLTATPNAGYEIDAWFVDGAQVQTGGTTYTLSNITAAHTVAVSFKILHYTLSGYFTEPDGNTAVQGVQVQAGGSSAVSGANGFYELQVDHGWSGTVTPVKTGYTFEPNGVVYSNVSANDNDENYTAALDTFTISGHVIKAGIATPISDVAVAAENGGGSYTSRYSGGSDTTDPNGYYEVTVDYNWSGKVIPTKEAYAFDPNSMAYTTVVSDYTDQDYTGDLLTYAISGHIRNSCSVPIKDVLVTAGGGNSVMTDTDGCYEVWVPYNWTGTITPSKLHYTFTPVDKAYVGVISNQTNQDYLAANIYDLDCDGSIDTDDLVILCGHWLSSDPDALGNLNGDNIVNFLDFAEFAGIW